LARADSGATAPKQFAAVSPLRTIACGHGPADAAGVPPAESFDRKLLTAAFTRARELLSSADAVSAAEVLHSEQTLRPLASAWEIQQVVVPLLDRAQLFGLAMAWDSGVDSKPEAWLLARAQRWVSLGAPEFGFLTLCELRRLNVGTLNAEPRLQAALDAERALRGPILEANLAVLAQVDRELTQSLHKAHRTSVTLRPLGAGCGEFAGTGQPWVQLWAVTPPDALADAELHIERCSAYQDGFIAGVGDCTLVAAAARLVKPGRRIHVVELHVSRMRALLEMVDLTSQLRARSLWLHAGPRAVETLTPYAENALTYPEAVAGGDSMAVSLLQAAAGQQPNDTEDVD